VAPVTLDACFQALIATLPELCRTYLPVRMDRIRMVPGDQRPAWGHVTLRAADANRLLGDVRVLDGQGNVLLEVDGFHARALKTPDRDDMQALYRYEWISQPGLNTDALDEDLPDPERLASEMTSAVREATLQSQEYYAEIRPELDTLSGEYIVEALS